MYYFPIVLAILAVIYMVFIVPKMMKNASKAYEDVKAKYTGKEDELREELLKTTFSVQQNAIDSKITSMAQCENHRTTKEAAKEVLSRAGKTIAKRAISGANMNEHKKIVHSFLAFSSDKLYYIENEDAVELCSKKLVFDINKLTDLTMDFNKLKHTHSINFSYENTNYKFSVYNGFVYLAGFGKQLQTEAAKAKFALEEPFFSRIKTFESVV